MSFMSEHLILQQDDPEFPLDPQLLIHAMWKELFDLELIDFSILRFDSELDEIMFPISLKDCDYQNLAPDFTELFDFIYNPPTGSGLQIIEVPAWVKRYRYKDGPQIIQYLDGPTNNPFDEVLKQTHISESYTWPWILWAFHEAEKRNEIVLGIGKVVVDVLEEYFVSGKLRMEVNDFDDLLSEKYGVEKNKYFVMTCHRRENVEDLNSLTRILDLAASCDNPVLFAAGYRTQKMISKFGIKLSKNVQVFDPIGYLELLELMVYSKGVLTDSGTVVEEACILGIPTIQMRRSTERPEVYIVGSSIKFDPASDQNHKDVLDKFYRIIPGSWDHIFGDGKASYRICEDLLECWSRDEFTGHSPSNKIEFSSRSYM